MNSLSLSQPALEVIQSYLHLPIPNKNVACPYFNNKKSRVRAGLRVLVGKGSIDDITEELMLISLREKIDLASLTNEQIKKILVDHSIGIDCSGLIYYVLDAKLQAQKKGKLKKHLKFPYIKNPLRKLLTKLRPVESTNVLTLAHEKNSTEVELKNIQPGDLIIMLKSGLNKDRDHVLIIHQVDYDANNQPKTIYYTHSLNWSTEGQYNHGVKQGRIEIADVNKNIKKQVWREKDKTGDENETFVRARTADSLKIVRLKD